MFFSLRRPRVALTALGLSLAFATACTKPEADGNKAADDKKVETPAGATAGATGPVAKVNGKEITRADFNKQMERTKKRFERAGREIPPALEKRLKENIIRKLVDDSLINAKATAEGIKVEAADLDAKFTEHKGRFGNEAAFTKYLERTGQTADDVKVDLRRNVLREKLFDKLLGDAAPTEAEAKAYYDKNKERYLQREQVRASHILFKTSKEMTPEQKAEKKKKAAEIMKLAKKTKTAEEFAALAKEHSEGPTASRGGDLGAFSRGRMVKPFEDAAFAAKANTVLGPVETQFGFHVIRVQEKLTEKQREYDEVKDSILTSLKARQKSTKTRELLKTLKEQAKIEVLEEGVSLEARPMQRPAGKPAISAEDMEKRKKAIQEATQKMKKDLGAKGIKKAAPPAGGR